jgi:hypothetical protein
VDDAGRVNVFEASKHLVDEELNVVVGETLGADDVVKVSAHQMGDQVDLLERLQCVTLMKDIEQSDDVLVIHVFQQAQLTKRPLGMGRGLKRAIQLLYRHFRVRGRVKCRAAKRERNNNRMNSSRAHLFQVFSRFCRLRLNKTFLTCDT